MATVIIDSNRKERQYWHDLWKYRELFYFLAWRDILVRYKQTVVGALWSFIRPFLTMVILSIVFGKFGNMPSGGVPYPILVFCGVLPWQLFATSLSESGNSLTANANLVSKVYFPRMIVPASSIIVSLVDFMIASVIFALLMLWYGFVPSANILFFPVFVLMASGASLGAGVWISALMVKYRDFRFIVPFVVQFGLYISPVGFTSSVVPDEWRFIYSLNPMAGAIDGMRWAILGGEHTVYWPGFIMSTLVILIVLIGGVWHFRRTETTFADVI